MLPEARSHFFETFLRTYYTASIAEKLLPIFMKVPQLIFNECNY